MRRIIVLLAVLAIVAAACSDDEPTAPSTTMSDMGEMSGMGDDMGGMAMNMGDPSATRADEVANADLSEATFVPLGSRPPGYDDITGMAWIARHDGGTTVTLELTGLEPGVDYISHVHEGTCAESGGDHYMFDPAGSEVPPNEIHLAFTSATDGSGFMTAENAQRADDDARSVVVHPVEFIDNKIACAEF